MHRALILSSYFFRIQQNHLATCVHTDRLSVEVVHCDTQGITGNILFRFTHSSEIFNLFVFPKKNTQIEKMHTK